MKGAKPSSPQADRAQVTVKVTRDRCEAELVIPRGIDRIALTMRRCIDAAESKNLIINKAVIEAIGGAIEAHEDNSESRHIIARSECAQRGKDGRIAWSVHSGYQTPPDTLEPVDHYDRASLPLVETDQSIGRIIPPTDGTDGTDVCGNPIKAEHGHPATLNHDETIRIDGDMLIACTCGLLEIQSGQTRIRDMIDIEGNVDFSTGHVEYRRDIRVRGGVGDRFEVNAGGNLLVEGLTEAATIKTGGDFEARGGMVGYPNGSVHIGGNFVARYLDSVMGHVTGSLHVEREVIHCKLTVMRDIEIITGALIGGTLTAGSAVSIATLGSGAGVSTTLRITAIGQSMDIRIARTIHPGVTLIAGAQKFYFNKAMRGPLRITRDKAGTITLAIGSAKPTLLAMVEGVKC